MLLLDYSIAFLVLSADVSKELFKVLRIIHDKLVYDCFVKIKGRELVGISFNDHCSHLCEML